MNEIKQAALYGYRLPMDSGVILRAKRLTERQGLIIQLIQGQKTGLGEIAPLPEFSQESLAEAKAQAIEVLAAWQADAPIAWDELYPSVAFGLSIALAELDGTLDKTGNYQIAPLCHGDPDELIARLADHTQAVAKMKVGLYEPIRDGMIVNMLLEILPQLQLRLDANRQWSLAKATQFARYIRPELRAKIAFLEEPCANPNDSLSFSAQQDIHLAWDERLRDIDFSLAELESQAKLGLKALVIKPSLIGSLDKIKRIISEAKRLKLEVVISSSLESSLGLTQLARLAKMLTPDTVPGLDTLDLFGAQLITPWPNSTLPVVELAQCERLWQA